MPLDSETLKLIATQQGAIIEMLGTIIELLGSKSTNSKQKDSVDVDSLMTRLLELENECMTAVPQPTTLHSASTLQPASILQGSILQSFTLEPSTPTRSHTPPSPTLWPAPLSPPSWPISLSIQRQQPSTLDPSTPPQPSSSTAHSAHVPTSLPRKQLPMPPTITPTTTIRATQIGTCIPVRESKIHLPSSEISTKDLKDPATVVKWYHKLHVESKAPTLAVKLARECFFGDTVMKLCTPMGYRDTYQ